MTIDLIDFDDIDRWAPELTDVLNALLPKSISRKMMTVAPRYVEDALDRLLSLSDRDAVLDSTVNWIRSKNIAGYHGSRLADSEIASIQSDGLAPLKAEARRRRLERALSTHRDWPAVANQLGATIRRYGEGNEVGCREGQVHLTLSKAGLTDGFNHYLTYGAEFDQHVAFALLGSEGKELLTTDGYATVVQIAVPGRVALEAAHPIFTIDDIRARGDIPNLVSEILKVWSYRLAHPGFQSRILKIDCGMIFRTTVAPEWIVRVDRWSESSRGK